MDFRTMRRITDLIGEHGPRLRGAGRERFFAKALAAWDRAFSSDPLPVAPNREPGKWEQRTDAINERRRKQGTDTGPDNKRSDIVLKLKPRKAGDTRPMSPSTSILQKLDGTKWLRMVSVDGKLTLRQLDKYFVPTFVETRKDKKQPADKAEKGDQQMQKSKLDSLIARARKNPAVLNQQTLTMLNNHLAKTGQPLVTVPAPTRTWGTMPNVSDIAANRQVAAANTAAVPIPRSGGVFSQVCVQAASQNGRATLNLTGHQRAAMGVGLDPATPGLEKMDINQMKAVAQQQQLATANALRQKQGLPPL